MPNSPDATRGKTATEEGSSTPLELRTGSEERPAREAAERGRHRRGGLPEGWPLFALFLSFPLWWWLGASAFIWPVLAIPFVVAVVRMRVRPPWPFAAWVLFLVWMLVSATRLDTGDRWLAFAYRGSMYAAATVFFLYVYGWSRGSRRATALTVDALTVLWGLTVVGGVLAMLAPHFAFISVVQRLLPDRLVHNQFVYDMVHPALAQNEPYFAKVHPTYPRGFFTYTNEWASIFALLTPFAIATFVQRRSWLVRGGVLVGFAAAVVPIVSYVSRGAMLSLAVGLAYGFWVVVVYLVRRRRGGSSRGVRVLVPLLLSVATAALALFAVYQVTSDRDLLSHFGDVTRTDLYREAWDRALQSPMLGYGAPRPSTQIVFRHGIAIPGSGNGYGTFGTLPSVGTHGQLWLVLFSHGFPGLAFFVGWLVLAFWFTSRRRLGPALACHVAVLIALVQMPYYELLPVQLQVVMIAIGAGWPRSTEAED